MGIRGLDHSNNTSLLFSVRLWNKGHGGNHGVRVPINGVMKDRQTQGVDTEGWSRTLSDVWWEIHPFGCDDDKDTNKMLLIY